MILHYIFDPLCGWCYAAAPLIASAATVPNLAIALHGGGMMTGNNRRKISPQWRDYVIVHDKRIAQMTGQLFGEPYYEGLLRNNDVVLDSEPPTTAILAAQEIDNKGGEMLARLQKAYYVEGKVISDPAILAEQAVQIGLNATIFNDTFERLQGEETVEHIQQSRQLLSRLGAQGFPSCVLEQHDQSMHMLDMGHWLGRTELWTQTLHNMANKIS